MLRWTWGPNQGARDAAFAKKKLVGGKEVEGEGMRRTGLSLAVER